MRTPQRTSGREADSFYRDRCSYDEGRTLNHGITGSPGLARRYMSARGTGGFVRASWDEAVELAATAHVHTIRTWGRTGSPGSAQSRR